MSRFPNIKSEDLQGSKELESNRPLPSPGKVTNDFFHRLQAEFDETFGLWCPLNQVELIQSLLPEQVLQHLAKVDAHSGDPAFIELSTKRGLLTVPISLNAEDKDHQPHLICFAEICSADARNYLKIANLVIRQQQDSNQSHQLRATTTDLQEQVSQLQEENQNYLVQITADMEELTFLRQLYGFLELKSHPSDCLQQLFMTVAAQVKANWVGFVPRLQSETSLKLPAVCFDNPAVPTDPQTTCHVEILERIVSSIQPTRKVTVVNDLESREFPFAPDIHSLLICAVEKSGREFGWLVAVNRVQNIDNDLSFAPTTLKSEFGSVEAGLLASSAAMLATHFSNLELLAANRDLVTDVVRCLVAAIESKDAYTCGHSERVAQYGRRIGQELGLNEKELERLYLSGLLHDVGKIGIADSILSKPSQPTDEEFEEIKKHPHEGWKILQGIKQLECILDGVLFHHERVDGRGYPDGLSGKDIPLAGRIIAVADSFDAMTSDRPYRSGMSPDVAHSIIQQGAGTQWDAEIVTAFFQILDDLESIRLQYKRLPAPNRIKNSIRRQE